MYLSYPVLLAEERVGEVLLRKQGLFFLLFCRCHLRGDFWLFLKTENGTQNLGICVPWAEGVELTTRIKASQILELSPGFFLKPKQKKGRFCPVSEELPFPMLRQLTQGRFQMRDGLPGVEFED